MTTNNAVNNASQTNLIIGGNYDTNPWQRGTSFVAAPDSTKTADRWVWQQVGTGVVTIAKTADAPTPAQAGLLVTNCYDTNVTTADAAIAAGDFYGHRYIVEGYDWAQIAQQTFTLSFWAKHTVTGTYCVAFTNDVDRTWIAEYTINTTNTWEYKTITVTASPSAGTWNYTNGIGLRIEFILAAGSTFQSTAGSWLSSSGVFATSNQVNGVGTNGNRFKVALLKIEPGSVATPWVRRSAQQELALCQRYYWKTFPQGTTPAQNTGSFVGALYYTATVAAANRYTVSRTNPVTMRATPSSTYYNPFAANANWRNLTAVADSGAASDGNLGDNGVYVLNAQAAGDAIADQLAIHATFDAEL